LKVFLRKAGQGDRRIFTPKTFGWGLSINFYELARRLLGRR
jgi:hypothetical protein